MNVFHKIRDVRKLLQPKLSEVEEGELIGLIRDAAKFHYNKRRKLSCDALKLYELLMKYSYNPYTVYRWFLLTKAPQETKDKLRLGEVSQRTAFKEKTEHKELLSTTERELVHEIFDRIERYVIR